MIRRIIGNSTGSTAKSQRTISGLSRIIFFVQVECSDECHHYELHDVGVGAEHVDEFNLAVAIVALHTGLCKVLQIIVSAVGDRHSDIVAPIKLLTLCSKRNRCISEGYSRNQLGIYAPLWYNKRRSCTVKDCHLVDVKRRRKGHGSLL